MMKMFQNFDLNIDLKTSDDFFMRQKSFFDIIREFRIAETFNFKIYSILTSHLSKNFLLQRYAW